jgi:predicted AlkP superfamily pyrophosphatase or phosphodiesterase
MFHESTHLPCSRGSQAVPGKPVLRIGAHSLIPILRWLSSCVVAGVALLIVVAPTVVMAAPVLIISVDGMKPEYVLQAEQRGLKLPYLKSLMSQGVYADGVDGVWPTVTYPSHTTLITGVLPADHGIEDNLEFDPEHHFEQSWFWYAQQIRVPTLWAAAHGAGLTTASVGWPVTVGATTIDYLIPEYWRISGDTNELNPSDRYLMESLSRPFGLLTQLQTVAGPYMMGNDTTLQGDEIKTRYAIEIIKRHKPAFMTVHLSSLDDAEHDHGVFSVQANADLEAIDAMLQKLATAAQEGDPATIVAVVSDHGFMPLTHTVNLYIPFLKAGLAEIAKDPETGAVQVKSWTAQPWFAGGMAAVMLKDPNDQHTAQVVGELLQKLAADPNNGIASVRNREALKTLGAFPEAAFVVTFMPGYYGDTHTSGDLVRTMSGAHGGHGFTPELAEMRAAFFISWPGIAHHRDLGIIDMRQIAPTLAQVLGVPLPTAHAAPLHIAP